MTSNAIIQRIESDLVNTNSILEFQVYLTNEFAEGDSIKFNSAEGFRFTKPKILQNGMEICNEIQVLPNNRMILCKSSSNSVQANISQTISISGVINPRLSGEFSEFSIEHLQGTSNNVLEKVSISNNVSIKPGIIIANSKPQWQRDNNEAVYQINLTVTNDIDAEEEVWIKMPSEIFGIIEACSILTPFQEQNESNIS